MVLVTTDGFGTALLTNEGVLPVDRADRVMDFDRCTGGPVWRSLSCGEDARAVEFDEDTSAEVDNEYFCW